MSRCLKSWGFPHHVILNKRRDLETPHEPKSNEITAIPELLEALSLKGCIVTLDAMHCQKKTAREMIKKEADDVITLKGNQGLLHERVDNFFAGVLSEESDIEGIEHHKTEEESHGRTEIRRYWLSSELDWLEGREEWEGLRSVGCVERERLVGTERTYECHLYISSLECDVNEFARAVRSHWEVENSLHWRLDVSFREDESRIREGYGAENMSLLRKIALNLLQQEQTLKRGIKTKRLKAAWDKRYLLKVLKGLEK